MRIVDVPSAAKEVIELFTSSDALGLCGADIDCDTGTLVCLKWERLCPPDAGRSKTTKVFRSRSNIRLSHGTNVGSAMRRI